MKITDTSDLWWKSAVVYCLDVETYLDWNDDGVGDFVGLSHRVDYLAELGVTCIWLMPFYPSPDKDDGYDISDFYGVDSRLGSHGDFVEFVRTAKDRGMRVIVDLVVNHTSDQHPWFVSARKSRESPYRDFYVWSDDPPNKDEPSVFPGEESGIWEWDEKTEQYYLHRFYKHQPDLNVANPRVRDELAKVIGFWLELGISGFRVDAVPFFLELPEGVTDLDPHEYLRDLRRFLQRRSSDAILLGEVNLPYEQQLEYFGGAEGGELSMQFDFVGMQAFYLSLVREDAAPLTKALGQRPTIAPESQWANFVRNHDELTLDKLSEEERQEVFDALAPEERMRVYDRGIVRRLPTMVAGDPRRLRMAYSLMFSLPGTPVLFYGEELGMGENLDAGGRAAVRTPMQWSTGKNGGFSSAAEKDLVAPITPDGYGPEFVNAAAQRHDPDSLLSFIKLLADRFRSSAEIGWGAFHVLEHDQPSVLAHSLEADVGRMIALHNFSPDARAVHLRIDGEAEGTELLDLLEEGRQELPADGKVQLDLPAYGYRWIRIVRPGQKRLS